ncbi:DUF6368 family protein [Kitasatospora sp. NPDC048545]|uniref:DUF6368 family protein n=1 Tax=Kitasatospora sp. NPDC048545 TaxID=3157208 RepID=UPI0033FAF40D
MVPESLQWHQSAPRTATLAGVRHSAPGDQRLHGQPLDSPTCPVRPWSSISPSPSPPPPCWTSSAVSPRPNWPDGQKTVIAGLPGLLGITDDGWDTALVTAGFLRAWVRRPGFRLLK